MELNSVLQLDFIKLVIQIQHPHSSCSVVSRQIVAIKEEHGPGEVLCFCHSTWIHPDVVRSIDAKFGSE